MFAMVTRDADKPEEMMIILGITPETLGPILDINNVSCIDLEESGGPPIKLIVAFDATVERLMARFVECGAINRPPPIPTPGWIEDADPPEPIYER